MPQSKSLDNVEVLSNNAADTCELCGLALRAGRHESTHADQTYQFCCQGCRQVFSILIEAVGAGDPATFRQSKLFTQCQELGIIPRSEADLLSSHADKRRSNESPTGPIEPSKRTPHSPTPAEGVLSLNLKISNMWCPACAWLIDESLKKTPGVIDSTCNFSTDRLQVDYNPIKTSPDRIIDAVKKLGYRAAEPDQSRSALERRSEFIRFGISAFLTMNIMMVSRLKSVKKPEYSA